MLQYIKNKITNKIQDFHDMKKLVLLTFYLNMRNI